MLKWTEVPGIDPDLPPTLFARAGDIVLKIETSPGIIYPTVAALLDGHRAFSEAVRTCLAARRVGETEFKTLLTYKTLEVPKGGVPKADRPAALAAFAARNIELVSYLMRWAAAAYPADTKE